MEHNCDVLHKYIHVEKNCRYYHKLFNLYLKACKMKIKDDVMKTGIGDIHE